MARDVPVENLRLRCDPEALPYATSEDLSPGKAIIGQQRATRALQFGLGIQAPGFNIFVAGLPGTGRTTAVKRFLEVALRNSFSSDSLKRALRDTRIVLRIRCSAWVCSARARCNLSRFRSM